jgi:hypothetical protein
MRSLGRRSASIGSELAKRIGEPDSPIAFICTTIIPERLAVVMLDVFAAAVLAVVFALHTRKATRRKQDG